MEEQTIDFGDRHSHFQNLVFYFSRVEMRLTAMVGGKSRYFWGVDIATFHQVSDVTVHWTVFNNHLLQYRYRYSIADTPPSPVLWISWPVLPDLAFFFSFANPDTVGSRTFFLDSDTELFVLYPDPGKTGKNLDPQHWFEYAVQCLLYHSRNNNTSFYSGSPCSPVLVPACLLRRKSFWGRQVPRTGQKAGTVR